MSKTSTFGNTAGLLTALFILTLCAWVRTDLTVYLTAYNYFSIASLAAILFILPDFLHSSFRGGDKWYRSAELFTMLLLLMTGLSGLFIPSFSSWPGFILIPAGIALAGWQFLQVFRKGPFWSLAAGMIFLIFMVLLFYSQDHHSLVFPEKIILGKVHIDILFHISMSNMFSTLGWASTGLDGAPYIPYHWGTHAMFAGMRNWTGIDTMMFYNVAYPAIFLPMFFKSLFGFMERVFRFKGVNTVNLLIAVTFMLFIYSLPFGGFQFASPLISESFTVAFLFMFLYGSALFAYIAKPDRKSMPFLVFTVAALIVISFFKISTGFICFTGLAYLYFRVNLNLRSLVRIVTGGIILAVLVYPFIYQVAYVAFSKTITERITLFWELSDGFFTYLAGAVIAILVVLKNRRLETRSDLVSILRSGKYIDMEVLFVITFTGILAGMYVSSNAPDVYYFCSIQLFISIPYLVLFSQKYFERFRASVRAKTVFLFFIIILCVVSRPDIMRGMHDTVLTRRAIRQLNQSQTAMRDLEKELAMLDSCREKGNCCIYIPKTENWYYKSQLYRPLGAPFVAPALSGIAMVGGVTDSILRTKTYAYSFYYYRNKNRQVISTEADAVRIALSRGYDELIAFRFTDSRLNKQIFHLKTHE